MLGLYGYLCARLEVALFRRDFRDLTKLLRQFVFCMVLSFMGSGVAITMMKLIPGLVGIWLASKVIEYLRKTMRFQKDFLTPLDPKVKLSRVSVTGEIHGMPAPAAAVSGGRSMLTPAAPKPGPIIRETLPVRPAPAYGFRPWYGRRGK